MKNMYLVVGLLLVIIMLSLLESSLRETFCPCGVDLTQNNKENFCSSGCAGPIEPFSNCPGSCSNKYGNKRYPLKYMYWQTCGHKSRGVQNTSCPYYLYSNY